MGGKLRTTKLGKIGHPYKLEANGRTWTVQVAPDGALKIEATDEPRKMIVIRSYGAFVRLEQE